jgi:hypothetical protein
LLRLRERELIGLLGWPTQANAIQAINDFSATTGGVEA